MPNESRTSSSCEPIFKPAGSYYPLVLAPGTGGGRITSSSSTKDSSTQITIEPPGSDYDAAIWKAHQLKAEASLSGQQNQHSPVKAQTSFLTRLAGIPNLTADDRGAAIGTGDKHRTCTKSVHKVVFLFCSVTLAIIIACIIFVEMKQSQDRDEMSSSSR